MKKTLQDQYLLIKEGKGHKGVFLSEAKSQFPNIVRNAATFEEAAASLITKNIISEHVVGTSVVAGYEPRKKETYETAFEAFLAEARKKADEDEKVKAEEKKVSKPVEEDLSKMHDNTDEKNPDNVIFDQIMMGYYAEMKDPKNADKTMQQLKDIVLKNLAKDPIYYTKDGQFGVKGLGYVTEHPGLGTPKEAKGKYKSSGYGDLNESIGRNYPGELEGEYEGELQKIYGSDIYDTLKDVLDISNSEDDFVRKMTMSLTDETNVLPRSSEEKLRNWYKKNTTGLGENLGYYKSPNPHLTNLKDIEDYSREVEGMSKAEAIEYLLNQGLSSSMIKRIISSLNTDVRDMFNQDPDVRINTSDDIYEDLKSDVKKEFEKKSNKKFTDEEIKAKLKQKREAELKRRKEAGEPLEEIALRKVIREMIDAELEEAYQLKNINLKATPKDREEREPQDFFTIYLNQATEELMKKNQHLRVLRDPKNPEAIKGVAIRSRFIAPQNIKKLPYDINPMFISFLNTANNIGGDISLPTKEGVMDKYTLLNNVNVGRDGRLSFKTPNPKATPKMEGLMEGIEKDLADINKEAEHEVLQSKLDKIDALIDSKKSKLSKLDEDEDMKALTDKKKVKELEKDIKKLEQARAKVEKMISKFKGKKSTSKEVIDEMEDEPSEKYLEYKEDAERRYEEGQSIDSIISDYSDLSLPMKDMLRNDLEAKFEGTDNE